MIFSKKYSKQKGFTLIELILVLGISTTALLSLLKYEGVKADQDKAKIVGQQMGQVGKALTTYITGQQTALTAIMATNSTITLPFTILTGTNSNATVGAANCYPNVAAVHCGKNLLPSTFNPTNGYGATYTLQVNKSINGQITGMVSSSRPVCREGSTACPTAQNPVRYDLAGFAVREMGQGGGLINLGTTTTMTGYNGGWTMTNATFNQLNQSGKIGYLAGATDGAYDYAYLKLDGTNSMNGNLNMGNWDINNATNITYNGWLSGNGILANQIRSGTIQNSGNINNTGDINTNNLYSNLIVKAGVQAVNVGATAAIAVPALGNTAGYTAPAAAVGNGTIQSDNTILANNKIVAMRAISTRDIFLGNNDAAVRDPNVARRSNRTLPNAWLSDLLPRYSSRGMRQILIPPLGAASIAKPDCGVAGTAKIEVIPQAMVTRSFINGTVQTSITLLDAGWSGSTRIAYVAWGGVAAPPNPVLTTFNGYAAGGYYFQVLNAGLNWTIVYQTTSNLAPTTNALVLAHTYCDYQF